MAEYLPVSSTKSVAIGYNEHFDIEFSPKKPGLVQVVSISQSNSSVGLFPNLTRGYRRSVELFRPGTNSPVASKEGRLKILKIETVNSVEGENTSGPWIARVTNLESGSDPREFKQIVSYPSETQILLESIPEEIIERFLNSILSETIIKLDSGEDASSISLFGYTYKWTLPTFRHTKRIKGPFGTTLGSYTITADVHDMSTKNVIVNLEPNWIRLDLSFETEDYEIAYRARNIARGRVDLTNPYVQIWLEPEIKDWQITYDPNTVRANVSFGVNFRDFPDEIERHFASYINKLEQFISEQLVEMLKQNDTREKFTLSLKRLIENVVKQKYGDKQFKLYTAKVSDGYLETGINLH